MIEREHNGSRGDPDREAKAWAEKLAEAARMRAGYQKLAAKGLITLEELGLLSQGAPRGVESLLGGRVQVGRRGQQDMSEQDWDVYVLPVGVKGSA